MAIFDKGVVWAKLEPAFGVDSLPGTVDAIEVIDPQFDPDFNRIVRQTLEGHMSPKPSTIARRLANLQFQLEVKGSGSNTTEGKLGRLLRACWMRPVTVAAGGGEANSVWDRPIKWGAPQGNFAFTKTGTYTGSYPRRIHIRCATPGASGVATFDITSPAVGDGAGGNGAINNTAKLMTDGQALVLGEGAAITPTVLSSFLSGDTFIVWLVPNGHLYLPERSTDNSLTNSAVTLYYYVDGALHKITGARGTVSASCTAGEIGLFTFNFTGDYVNASGPSIPTGNVFETTEPPQVELANLWLPYITSTVGTNVGKQNTITCPSQFSFDIANTVVPQVCVNAADGNKGAKISSRAPTFSADPEFIDEDEHGFFKAFETAQKWDVGAVVGGGTVGNAVAFICPQLQTDAQPYSEREGARVVDINAVASRLDPDLGGDELAIWVG